MDELELYLLIIVISTIAGKAVFKIQSNILLFLIITIFFSGLTFILCFVVDKEKEEKPKFTDKAKKEMAKFLILEVAMWIVIIVDDLVSDTMLTACSSLCMYISLLLWMKFTIFEPCEDCAQLMKGKIAWLCFCVMPAAWFVQFVIWIIKAYSPIFSSLVSSSPFAL